MDTVNIPEDPEPQPESESFSLNELSEYLKRKMRLFDSWGDYLDELYEDKHLHCPGPNCACISSEINSAERQVRTLSLEIEIARTAMRFLTDGSQGKGV